MEQPKNQNKAKTKKSIVHEGDKRIETTITEEGNKTTTHIITTKNDVEYKESNGIDFLPNEYVLESKESDLIDFPITELIIESEAFENGQNQNKKKIETNKKIEIEEEETRIKEEEETRIKEEEEINKTKKMEYEILDSEQIEKNSILYDSNSHYSSVLYDEEKVLTHRSSNNNINININDKYSPYLFKEEITNASNGANDITEEEIHNEAARIIQRVFRGYILRKVFFTNIQFYLDFAWSCTLLESILRIKKKKKFFYYLRLYDFNKRKVYMKNILNINAKKLPKIFIKKKYALLTDLKVIKNDRFGFIKKRKENITKKTIKEYNEKKIEKKIIIPEDFEKEYIKIKKENEKLKEENESLKIRTEYITEYSKDIHNIYKEIKIKYIFKDEDGKIVDEKYETVMEQPDNLIDLFKRLEKELNESNDYIDKLKKENKKFDDKLDKIISDINNIIENQKNITNENKSTTEQNIDDKLELITTYLNELKIERIEIEQLKNENEKLKKLLKEKKNNPLSGSSFTFGKSYSKDEDDLEKRIDDFLLKSKSFYDKSNKPNLDEDINNQSINFKSIYSLLQDSKDKIEDSKNEINGLKKENENLKNNLKESINIYNNEDIQNLIKENEELKKLIEEKNKEIEKLREQCKKALTLSDKIQKNKLLKELEQDEINKSKEERKKLLEMSSNRKKIPFEEINEVKKENVKLKEQISQLQNEIDLLNKRKQLRTKDDKDNEIINSLKNSNEQLKIELKQEKEFTDKFKKEKIILNNKMRETILRQLLFNYMRKDERSLSYNFILFTKACLKKEKEKLIKIFLKDIIQNYEKDKLYYLRKYFLKLLKNGILKEINMTNSQKQSLEKRKNELKLKYEKEKLAEKYDKENPEEAKKIREEIKLIEEEQKKNSLNQSIISPDLTDEEKREIAKKKYLKDLFYNKIKAKAHFIHNAFNKFYYRGIFLRMKYGNKLKDKLQIPENNLDNNSNLKKFESLKSENEILNDSNLENLTPKQKLEEQRRRARALRKHLKDKKDEDKKSKDDITDNEKDNNDEILINSETGEIIDDKSNKKKSNKHKTIKELEIEELLSKFLYKIERVNNGIMKAIFTKWNYITKLIKMKEMRLVRRPKRKRKNKNIIEEEEDLKEENNNNNLNDNNEDENDFENNGNYQKKLSYRERRKLQKEKEKEEREKLENENKSNIKGLNKFNLKEIQSENPLNETDKNDNLEQIKEDEEYYYELMDIKDEIKKLIKLYNIVNKKLNYPIRKCLNYWLNLTQNSDKEKFKSIHKFFGISIEESDTFNLNNLLSMLTSPDYNIFSTVIKLTEKVDKNILKILSNIAKRKLMHYLKQDIKLLDNDENLKIQKESKVIIKEDENKNYEFGDKSGVEIFKETKTITTKSKIVKKKKKHNK